MNLTVLGIGKMGSPIARRLLAAGFSVAAYNRTRARAEQVAGATVHDTAAQAVASADVVISLLENGPVVGQVLFGHADSAAQAASPATASGIADSAAAPHMAPGSLYIEMASIQPAEARSHAARLAALGVTYVDAPVSGGTLGAEDGTLAIMAGGSEADVARAIPVLQHLGRITHVGPVGTGQLAKLCNQMIVGISIGAVAEALLLAERGGADPAKVRQALGGGFADSRVLQVHGQRMLQRDFAARGSMAVQLKDLRNALATAHPLGQALPITRLLANAYADGVANGLQDLDHSALFLALAQQKGVGASPDGA
jgi:3-hydroxyisobutyrate dehydrogenase-like beta-hydroxyacid dehydrogenase